MQGECFICGKQRFLEEHHIFGASNRKKSTQYGLTVQLCVECHRAGRSAAHLNSDTMLYLHRYGQEKWQAEQGKTAEDFIREFGKNYL
jgi:hypothetical protein